MVGGPRRLCDGSAELLEHSGDRTSPTGWKEMSGFMSARWSTIVFLAVCWLTSKPNLAKRRETPLAELVDSLGN